MNARPSLRRRGVASLTVVAALGALALTASWWARRVPEIRREPGLSVLLITIDTLRADALGAYGHVQALTPRMDRLAAAGIRFTNAHAHNVVTLPSLANILSGHYPFEHGVRDNAGFRFPAGHPTLATHLRAHGYRTGAFVSAFPLDSRFGLDRGFDLYEDSFVDAAPRPAFLMQERRGADTAALARQWMEAQGDDPFFCWVHLYEPHFPYQPPAPLASRFRDAPYHGEVAAADLALAPLVEPILDVGREGRTLVVVTSDHGEALGEHGEATHGIFAYEATLRVPLIVYQPRLWDPQVVGRPARHIDLLPTILDALALPLPDGLPGRSLLPVIALSLPRSDERPATDDETTTYFEALSGALNRGWAPLRGVIRGTKKYIELPIPELYDLAVDPGEMRNLAALPSFELDQLRAGLTSLRAADQGTSRRPEDAETRQRLLSLGYISAGSGALGASYTEDDDPKGLIGLDALLQEVVGRYMDGDLPGALARGRALVARRPGMPIAWLHLAHLQRESGDLGGAIESLQKAAALDPGAADTVALLGAYLTEAGRAREAADLLEPLAAPQDATLQVLVTRGLALARAGRVSEAVTTLDRARRTDPSNAMVLVELGTVHLIAHDRSRARQAFEEALRVNAQVARAHTSLGALAIEEGRATDAVTHWREAVRIDPREYQTLLGLGLALARAGRRAEARPYLTFFADTAPPERYARETEHARQWLRPQ